MARVLFLTTGLLTSLLLFVAFCCSTSRRDSSVGGGDFGGGGEANYAARSKLLSSLANQDNVGVTDTQVCCGLYGLGCCVVGSLWRLSSCASCWLRSCPSACLSTSFSLCLCPSTALPPSRLHRSRLSLRCCCPVPPPYSPGSGPLVFPGYLHTPPPFRAARFGSHLVCVLSRQPLRAACFRRLVPRSLPHAAAVRAACK